MMYYRLFSTSLKLLSAAAFAFLLSGCGGHTPIKIEDKSAGLVEFAVEKSLYKKLSVKVRYSQLTMQDELTLYPSTSYNGYTSQHVLTLNNGQQWRGPALINVDFEIQDLGLELVFIPLNNQYFKIELGGGVDKQQQTLRIKQAPEGSTDISQTLTRINSRFSFKPSPTTLITLGLEQLDNDIININRELSFSWLPVPQLQLSVGRFWYNRESSLDSLGTIGTQWEITSPDEEPTVSRPRAYSRAISGIEATGYKGSITLKF